MSGAFVRVRRVFAAGVCFVSVLCGIVLVFRLITPRALEHVGTPELVALLGLLVMPGATGCAFLIDRRAHRRAATLALAEQAEQLRLIAEAPAMSRAQGAWERGGRDAERGETGTASVRAYAAVRYGLEVLPHGPHRGEERPTSGRHLERARHHDADERSGAESRPV